MTVSVFDRVGSVRAAAVLRILLGPITLLHLQPFLSDARAGIAYDDHFWKPFVPWLPRPHGDLWFIFLWVGAIAAVLMGLGLFTRVSTSLTFAVVAGNILLSQTHFRHNRVFLALLLAALALLPAGRVLSVDAALRRLRGKAPLIDQVATWPLWMLRVQVSLVYAASGVSKLLDPDWLGGLVLWDRVVRYQHVLDPTPLPPAAIDLLTARWLYYGAAPAAIAIELFLAVALWRRRTRLAAIWVAVVFHVAIEVSASIEVFSYAALAALTIWGTPSTRDRVLRVSPVGARAVRLADWFARFRVETVASGGPAVTVVDRDGTVLTGRHAVLFALTRLPLTFPFATPLWLVAERRLAARHAATRRGRTSPEGCESRAGRGS